MNPNKYIGMLYVLVCVCLTVGFKTNCEQQNKGYYKLNVQSAVSNNVSDSVIVTGKVFDLKTKKPLESSVFMIKNSKTGCIVDKTGSFEKAVKIGTYKFQVSAVGNTSLSTKSIKLEKGTKYNFDIYLDSQIIYSK